MHLYHFDVHSQLLDALEKKVGSFSNLRIKKNETATNDYCWSHYMGYPHTHYFALPPFVSKNSPEKRVFVNQDGNFHHFTYYILHQYANTFPKIMNDFAYLHVDRHSDLISRFTCGLFVSHIFQDLKIPTYILTKPIGEEAIEKNNDLDLLHPLTDDQAAQQTFKFQKKIPAVVLNNIPQKYLYISLDVDAFPPNVFQNHWYSGKIVDFDVPACKRIIKTLTDGHEVIGADIVGIETREVPDPANDFSLKLVDNMSWHTQQKRAELRAERLAQAQERKRRIEQQNIRETDTYVDLTLFLKGLME